MLVGAAQRDLSISLFGRSLPTRLPLAPVGVIGLCAQDGHGDLATARAAAKSGVPMIASTLSVDRSLSQAPARSSLTSSTDCFRFLPGASGVVIS